MQRKPLGYTDESLKSAEHRWDRGVTASRAGGAAERAVGFMGHVCSRQTCSSAKMLGEAFSDHLLHARSPVTRKVLGRRRRWAGAITSDLQGA